MYQEHQYFEKTENKRMKYGIELTQIRYTKDNPFFNVKAGQLGGWMSEKAYLEQNGKWFLHENAEVYDGVILGGVILGGVILGGVILGGRIDGDLPSDFGQVPYIVGGKYPINFSGYSESGERLFACGCKVFPESKMYQFTEEQFAKIESKINKMGELLFEIREDLREFGVEPKDIYNIPFLGDLNTSLSAQVEGLPEYCSDRTFENWKEKKVEITKLEDTFLYIIPKESSRYPKGTEIKIPGKVNFGSGIVAPFYSIMDDELIERIFVKESDGKEIDVCLDCFEGLVSDGNCLACGIMNMNG